MENKEGIQSSYATITSKRTIFNTDLDAQGSWLTFWPHTPLQVIHEWFMIHNFNGIATKVSTHPTKLYMCSIVCEEFSRNKNLLNSRIWHCFKFPQLSLKYDIHLKAAFWLSWEQLSLSGTRKAHRKTNMKWYQGSHFQQWLFELQDFPLKQPGFQAVPSRWHWGVIHLTWPQKSLL